MRNPPAEVNVLWAVMGKIQVLTLTAEQCRRLALRVRTEVARQQLLRLAEQFQSQANEANADAARQPEPAD